MDNSSSQWESGFDAGVNSRRHLFKSALARVAELEMGDFVPRSDLAASQEEVLRLKGVVSSQANAIRRLANRLKKL